MFLGVFRNPCFSLLLCALCAVPQAGRADVYDDVERLLHNSQAERALQLSEQHLQSRPQDPQMRLLLGRLQDALGKTDQAHDTLQALTLEFPELPEPHNNLAVLLARQGRVQEAIESLQRALQTRPDYTQALDNLGDLYLHLAHQAYLRASHTSPPSSSATHKAEILAPLLAR